jgi:ParB-like chromosome segregation protein Spo0J
MGTRFRYFNPSQQDKTVMAKKASKKSKSVKATKQTSNPKFKIVAEFRDLLPALTLDEYKTLERSICEEGLREPLLVWKERGILIDGHNRLKICREHGKKYRIIEKSFGSKDDVKFWIWENQEGRRNMTTFQRIEASLKLKDVIMEQAKKNQQAGGKVRLKLDKPIHTYKMLGKRAGVSHGTVRKAEAILGKVAEGLVSAEDIEALRRGKKSVSSVYNKYCLDQAGTSKATQKPPKDLARHIKITLSTLDGMARQLSQDVDHKSFYDQIIKWANTKKAGVVEPFE